MIDNTCIRRISRLLADKSYRNINDLLDYFWPHVSTFRMTLHWRSNDHDGVSNHQPHGCLLNRLFSGRSKKTSKLRVTGFCVGNSPGPVNSPHKGLVTRKMFPFGDVIMNITYTDAKGMWCAPVLVGYTHMPLSIIRLVFRQSWETGSFYLLFMQFMNHGIYYLTYIISRAKSAMTYIRHFKSTLTSIIFYFAHLK